MRKSFEFSNGKKIEDRLPGILKFEDPNEKKN